MMGLLGWLREHLLSLALVASAYTISYLATIQTRDLFVPDTRYYAAMSLWYGGTSQEDAARQVAAHSALFGWESPGPDQLFGWGLVQPRVVYPALSMPFVKMFGIPGLAVVSGVAMALLLCALLLLLARRYGQLAALGPVLMICVSVQLMYYGTAMLTESLSALWSVLLLGVAWRYVRTPTLTGVALLIGLTVLSGFTRQATLIPAGAMVMAWFCAALLRQRPNPWRVPAITVGGTAIGLQFAQFWLFPGFSQLNQLKMKTGADTLGEALRGVPALALEIVRADVTNLAPVDRPLLVLLALGLISMVIFWRRTESHMLLGALLAYELYNVTNGTPTAFRYGMPALAFVAASVALLLSRAGRVDARAAMPERESEPAR